MLKLKKLNLFLIFVDSDPEVLVGLFILGQVLSMFMKFVHSYAVKICLKRWEKGALK